MKFTKEPKLYFRIFLSLLLGICCFIQVKESMVKYLAEKKSIFVYKRKQNTAKLPIVTVCPSTFKDSEKFNRLMSTDIYQST